MPRHHKWSAGARRRECRKRIVARYVSVNDVDALIAITELTCDLAETERKHEPLTEANAYADRVWAQGIQDESVTALYERMKEIYARL